jgi:hypothetical protein
VASNSTELVLFGLPKILFGFIGSLVLVPIRGTRVGIGIRFGFMTVVGLPRLGPVVVIVESWIKSHILSFLLVVGDGDNDSFLVEWDSFVKI